MILPTKGEGNQNAKSIMTIGMMLPHPTEIQHSIRSKPLIRNWPYNMLNNMSKAISLTDRLDKLA